MFSKAVFTFVCLVATAQADQGYKPDYEFAPDGSQTLVELVKTDEGNVRRSPHSGKSDDEIMVSSIQALHERWLKGDRIKIETRNVRSTSLLNLRDIYESLLVIRDKGGVLQAFSKRDLANKGEICMNTIGPAVHHITRLEYIVTNRLSENVDVKSELLTQLLMVLSPAKKIFMQKCETSKNVDVRKTSASVGVEADRLALLVHDAFRNVATKY